MSIIPKPTTESHEYRELVERFTWLVDKEMTKYEGLLKDGELDIVIENMPKLVSLVNSIGYLRGQDNAFEDQRPVVIGMSTELYANENFFEKRLNAIIDAITNSDEKHLTWYRSKMEQYFIKARGAEPLSDVILGHPQSKKLKKLVEKMK